MTSSGVGDDGVGVDGDVELTEFDYEPGETLPSTAVIEAIADVEETSPHSLSREGGPILYEYVDPEALNRLVSERGVTDVEITLSIDRYTVWVEPDTVLVANTDRDDGGTP